MTESTLKVDPSNNGRTSSRTNKRHRPSALQTLYLTECHIECLCCWFRRFCVDCVGERPAVSIDADQLLWSTWVYHLASTSRILCIIDRQSNVSMCAHRLPSPLNSLPTSRWDSQFLFSKHPSTHAHCKLGERQSLPSQHTHLSVHTGCKSVHGSQASLCMAHRRVCA